MGHRITLLLGGNKGDMNTTLQRAIELLSERVGEVVATSSIYRSEAWGFSCDAEFYNQAVVLTTSLEPERLLDVTQSIEAELGRDRSREMDEKMLTKERYCSRTMDIDIMFYDDEVISTERLTIPHPLMQQREFALEPMCELEPARVHPTLGLSLKEIYENLKR